MILAYPYFRRDNIFYYMYKRVGNKVSFLSYDVESEQFLNILHRVIKDNKVTLDYRPKRTTVHMMELIPMEE